MKSTLMRVSIPKAEVVKERAEKHGRTHVAELDRIIDAGVAALDKADARRRKAS